MKAQPGWCICCSLVESYQCELKVDQCEMMVLILLMSEILPKILGSLKNGMWKWYHSVQFWANLQNYPWYNSWHACLRLLGFLKKKNILTHCQLNKSQAKQNNNAKNTTASRHMNHLPSMSQNITNYESSRGVISPHRLGALRGWKMLKKHQNPYGSRFLFMFDPLSCQYWGALGCSGNPKKI